MGESDDPPAEAMLDAKRIDGPPESVTDVLRIGLGGAAGVRMDEGRCSTEVCLRLHEENMLDMAYQASKGSKAESERRVEIGAERGGQVSV